MSGGTRGPKPERTAKTGRTWETWVPEHSGRYVEDPTWDGGPLPDGTCTPDEDLPAPRTLNREERRALAKAARRRDKGRTKGQP